MNEDRLYRIVGVLSFFIMFIAIGVGKLILAFIAFMFGIGIFFTSRKGSYNDKNLYDKKVKANDKTLEELFDFLKDIDTPLGKCWAGVYKGMPAIIYGPSSFKDVIVITLVKDEFKFRNVNILDNITAGEEDEWRLTDVADTANMEVTQKAYSVFASLKVMSAVMTGDLADLTADFTEGKRSSAPASLDMFEFYRHNTKDNQLVDANDEAIINTFIKLPPLTVTLTDDDGEELAKLEPQVENYVDATAVDFDIYSDGEKFGTITHLKGTEKNTYLISTVNGDFLAESFMAVRKANVSSNYTISKDGVRKAVVFGSPNINFEGHGGFMQNNVICSFDDDYLVLYTLFELYVISAGQWLR